MERIQAILSEFERLIDNTDFFELMMRNAWHMSGGKGQCEEYHKPPGNCNDKHGKQSVQEVKNDLFIGKNDEKAMEDNLRKQGLEFEKMELYAKMDDEKDQFGAQKGRDQFKNRPAMKSRGNNKREWLLKAPPQSQKTTGEYCGKYYLPHQQICQHLCKN